MKRLMIDGAEQKFVNDFKTAGGQSIETAATQAAAAFPKAGGTLTGDVETQNAKDLDTVIDNADAGNIGKDTPLAFSGDVDTININGFTSVDSSATNIPLSESGSLVTSVLTALAATQIFSSITSDRAFIRRKLTTWLQWKEIYSAANTGIVTFDDTLNGTTDELALGNSVSPDVSKADFSSNNVTSSTDVRFLNNNGVVGSITKSGTATFYNTASDPRLKTFKGKLSDDAINDRFNLLFDAYDTFNWKSDPDGKLVVGFNAHKAIDNGLDMCIEGNGPRDLDLKTIYDTTPAVFENQEQQVLYKSGDKKGQPRFNTDKTPMMETVIVETKAAVEHEVSPALIDESKAVTILLAKIEQLERRLSALEG